MHTVLETRPYLVSAKEENISDAERQEIVTYIANNPDAGDIMAGTGGARKLRFASQHKGKSGGYRIITFYAADDMPVFLLDIYSKSSQENLSKADRNELRKILTMLPTVWRESVSEQVKKIRRKK